MIFVILGSQKNQFNRLLKSLDEQVSSGLIKDELFAQTGYCDYEPKCFKFRQFLDRDVFTRTVERAELVITHGGTGAIMSALKKGKPVIAVPRRFELGEHNDNHQIEVVSELADAGIITCCEDTERLAEMIAQVKRQNAGDQAGAPRDADKVPEGESLDPGKMPEGKSQDPASKAYRSGTENYIREIGDFLKGI